MSLAFAHLLWLPVGAGGHVVVHTSRWWEAYRALRERRPAQRLFHAALVVMMGGERYTIEMTPAWGVPRGSRGVVATGPVGLRVLGRSRFFRYEVRCWPGGVIPDEAYAVGSGVRFALSDVQARALIARVGSVPTLVWGRNAFATGDMWNSNSLIAWLLSGSGIDASRIEPPDGGRAPGWSAGVAAAAATAHDRPGFGR